MNRSVRSVALIGDYSPDVTAHRAIPRALELVRAGLGVDIAWQWIATRDVRHAARDLAPFSAVWLVPASPYENTAGALDAVRFARETPRPFLGTCGGFQHALIEFARNVAGLARADHAETNPTGDTLVVTRLACSLVEKTSALRLAPDSLIRAAYGRDTATEGYHCNYGPAPEHRAGFEHAGLRFTAFDEAGEVRAAELPPTVHPFFVGTLFQPERAALRGEMPPLVRAFVRAMVAT
ncbi:MAG TPA: CTP synthase [Opitutaceae bacterium]|nr:CTP synthase [Opitutaceae bacterium]